MEAINTNLFCSVCGMLLDYRLLTNRLTECSHCGNNTEIDTSMTDVDKSEVKGVKEWLNEFHNITTQKIKKEALIIDNDCQKCDSKKMKYFTLQTRSVDEGTTVFYECVKCGFFFSTNN